MPAKLEAARAQLPVTLLINGNRIKARPGQTILEVVREQNLDDIPTLCYDPRLESYGSCFLCVVEVKGSSRLLPSCVTSVRDGMEVTTRSERIIHARKAALNLLLSDHYADCVCPASNACPAGVDIQGYLGLASLGHYAEALALVRERNPLPVVCGRVCVRKCEVKCLRNRVDQPVGINFVKRYIAEHAAALPAVARNITPTGKRVAIVGGGPAGLSCANYLALRGHAVTIFESMPKLGGMLRYGIPAYRLPRAELDEEIRGILGLGIEVQTSQALGKDFTLKDLLRDRGYHAVFLAMGAPRGKKLGVPGELNSFGVRSALEFLRSVELSGSPVLCGKVAVVGGGNSAIDAARTALRSGAEAVTILYRRTRKEMPADPEEVTAAEREGVKLEFLVAPREVLTGSDGCVEGVLCQRMVLGEPDESGRRAPIPRLGSVVEFACDTLLTATGQNTDLAPLLDEPEELRPGVNRQTTLAADADCLATRANGVFAGGDVVIGPSSVIEAVAHGRIAADAIDTYIRTGEVHRPEKAFSNRRGDPALIPDWMFEGVARSQRSIMPTRTPSECVRDFAPVEVGLSQAETRREARRCMECGCSAIFRCDLRRYAAEYGIEISPFAGESRRHRVDRSHPLLTLDPNKCILCGKCVRTCAELVGLSILGFVGRGFGTLVKPARGVSMGESACIACGACVERCPTGAISASLPCGRQGPWQARKVASVCNFCSIGCSLDLNVVSDGLLWASSCSTGNGAAGDLCWKGRFGTGLIHEEDRLRSPLVRRNGHHEEVPWDEAIREAAHTLRQHLEQRGTGSVTVMAAPRMTLEEACLTRHLGKEALGGADVGSYGQNRRGGPRHDLDPLFGETSSSCRQEDLDSADLVLISGADPSATHPVLAMAIRRAARRGAEIVAVNSSRIDLVNSGGLWLDARRGTAGILYAALANHLLRKNPSPVRVVPEGALAALRSSVSFTTIEMAAGISGIDRTRIERFGERLASARRIVAIYDLDNTLERAVDDLLALAQLLVLTGRIPSPGQGLLLLQSDCNGEGGRLAEIAGQLRLESIGGAVVMYEDPCVDVGTARDLRQFEPLVVIDHFMTETARRASVVLPASTLAEATGTLITYDRKVKAVNAGNRPPAGLTTSEVLVRLSRALGVPMPFGDQRTIRASLASSLGMDPGEFEHARLRGETLPRRIVAPDALLPLRLDTCATDSIPFPYATLDFVLRKKASAWSIDEPLPALVRP